MKIEAVHINTPDIARHTGYGRASFELSEAVQRVGIQVKEDADIVVNFCMPKDYIFRDYSVGYTPWESTEVPDKWLPYLNEVDDLWSTSTWTATVFEKLIGRKVFVLHHGLNTVWSPSRHNKNKQFTFLHVGEPALRKGGDVVLKAWWKAFRNSDCKLIYKATGIPMARVKDRGGSIVYSPVTLVEEGGQVINEYYRDIELLDLYSRVDCLVYPTRGEGFGFIPLEAMASGLPTILPAGGGTGDFSKFGVSLDNYLWRASGAVEHPGLWMDHDVDEVVYKMRLVRDHYEMYADQAYRNASKVKHEFDWDEIAKKFIDKLETGLDDHL